MVVLDEEEHGVLVITDVTSGLKGEPSCSPATVGVSGEDKGPFGE